MKRGGIGSTNCYARDDSDRDTHIELVLDPMHGGSALPMIVEVSTLALPDEPAGNRLVNPGAAG